MPKQKPRPTDEKPQRDRFIETAREMGASEDPEDFERAFKEVVRPEAGAISVPPSRQSGKKVAP